MQKRKQPSFVAALFGRIGRGKEPPNAATPATPPRPFQAIGIHHGTVCCAAAKKADGYRFLARDAPPLPLSGCTMRMQCDCRYIKFNDRRGGPRRFTEFGLRPTLFGGAEQRKKKGRRAKD